MRKTRQKKQLNRHIVGQAHRNIITAFAFILLIGLMFSFFLTTQGHHLMPHPHPWAIH